MVTVNLTNTTAVGAKFPSRDYLKTVGVLSRKFSVAEAVAQKGSAIAASDVFNVIPLPDGCILLGAQVFVEETPATGQALEVTLDIGWSGSADLIADGVNLHTSGVAAIGTNGNFASYTGGVRFNASNAQYIDLKIATLSGTLLSGIVRIDAVIADVTTDFSNPSNV